MNESSSGKDNDLRTTCLSIVLRRCIGVNKALTKVLAFTLQTKEVAESELTRKWIDLVKKDETETALSEMMNHVISSEPGFSALPDYLREADVPENVISLVTTIVEDKAPTYPTLELIRKWDALAASEENLKRDFTHLYSENASELQKDWPLNFIIFSTNQANLKEMETMLKGLGPDSATLYAFHQHDAVKQSSGNASQDGTTENAQDEPHSFLESFEHVSTDEIKQTHGSEVAELVESQTDQFHSSEFKTIECEETGNQTQDEPEVAELVESETDQFQSSKFKNIECEETGNQQLGRATVPEDNERPESPQVEPKTETKQYVPDKYSEQQSEVEPEVAELVESETDRFQSSEFKKIECAETGNKTLGRTTIPEDNARPDSTQVEPKTETKQFVPDKYSQYRTEAAQRRGRDTTHPTTTAENRQCANAQFHGSEATTQTPVRPPTPTPLRRKHTSHVVVQISTAGNIATGSTEAIPPMEQAIQPTRETGQETRKIGDEKRDDKYEKDSNYAAFLVNNSENLNKCEELIRPICELAWPEKQITDWNDLDNLLSSTDDRTVQHFIAVCKLIFNKRETPKDFQNAKPQLLSLKWILKSKRISGHRGKSEMLVILYELTWRDRIEEAPNLIEWPPLLREKSKDDDKHFQKFMQVADMCFELIEKFSPEDEPQTKHSAESQAAETKLSEVKNEPHTEQPTGTSKVVKPEIQEVKMGKTQDIAETEEVSGKTPLPVERTRRGSDEVKNTSEPPIAGRDMTGHSATPMIKDGLLGTEGTLGTEDFHIESETRHPWRPRSTSAPKMQSRSTEGQERDQQESAPRARRITRSHSQISQYQQPLRSTTIGSTPTSIQSGAHGAVNFQRLLPVRRRRTRSKPDTRGVRNQYETETPQEMYGDLGRPNTRNLTLQTVKTHSMKLRLNEREAPGIVLRVAVIGLMDDKDIFFREKEGEFCPMDKLSEGIYTLSLEFRSTLTYNYYTHTQKYGHQIEFAPGVRSLHLCQNFGMTYQLDEAMFCQKSSIPGQFMHLHLPTKYDEVLRSEFLKYEVFIWLHQMRLGWSYQIESHEDIYYPKKEMIDGIILNWLKSLGDEERTPVTLAVALALSNCKYDAERFLVEQMIVYMDLTTLSAESQEELYRKILTLFTCDRRYQSKSLEPLCRAMVKLFRAACVHSPQWLTALPLFYLVHQDGHVTPKEADGVCKAAFLPCKAGDEMTESLKSVWKQLGDQKNEKDYQKDLRTLSGKIMLIEKVHPWIVYIYQNLLNGDSIHKLILEGDGILKTFQIDRFVQGLISHPEACSRTKSGKNEAVLVKVEELFVNIFSCMNFNFSSFTEEEVTECVNVMKTTLKAISKSLKQSQNDKYSILYIKIAACVAVWSYRMISESKENTPRSIDDTVNDILDVILKKINNSYISKHEVDLAFFDELLLIQWHAEFQDMWIKAVQAKISSIIETIWRNDVEDYLKFFSKKIMPVEITCEELVHCFVKKALRCAQLLLERDRNAEPRQILCLLYYKPKWASGKVELFEKLFLEEFHKYYSNEEKDSIKKILKFVCEWPLSVEFFRTFNEKDALESLPRVEPKFRLIEKTCEKFVSSLDTKEVQADELNLIKDHRPKICQFLRMSIATSQGSRTDGLGQTIDKLFDRMEIFRREQHQANIFMNYCTQLQSYGIFVDLSKLAQLYKGISDSSPLKDFFTHEDVESNPRGFLGFTAKHMREFPLMEVLKKSEVFSQKWGQEAKDYKAKRSPENDIKIDWKDALSEIWETTKSSVLDLTLSIQRGNLDLKTAESKFKFCEGRRDIIAKEIHKLYGFVRKLNGHEEDDNFSARQAERAISQIFIVFEMKKYGHGLRWILDFKEKFDLKGEFTILDHFPDWADTDMTINDVNENILKGYPEQIMGITNSELDSLQTFLQEGELISWLQTMNDVSGVKMFHDLVTSSPGENPYEDDRVSYLLNAAQGFEPLLFRLDEVNSLEDLMERCSEVNESIKGDPKIVHKWTDSARHLQWFTDKERLYGSDQKLCLRRAQEINERGVYTIGWIAGAGKNPTIKNSIALTVQVKDPTVSPHKTTKQRSESYTLNELQDLQSKLMLIAGEEDQGQQDIRQFVDLFAAVKTLGEAFVNLVDAGCMLFSQWTAVVGSGSFTTANRQAEQNLRLAINFMEKGRPLAGAVSLGMLQELSRALRQAYEQWAKCIASKRLEHYYLNEYSIRQITYLCHQLAKSNNIASLPDQVLALLSKDSKCVVTGAIQDALDEAFKINDYEEEVTKADDSHESEEESKLTDLEKKKRTIRILVNRERLEEDLAKAAVQAVGYDDIEECNNWALINEFDKKVVKEFLKKYDDENACALQSHEEEELTTLLENRSVRSLAELIDQISKTEQTDDSLRIVGAVRTICLRYYEKTSVLTLQDYLSVEHLGRFLTVLHEKHDVKKLVERSLIAPLEPGNPNLIICPEQEILPVLLEFYMESPQQPLPTASEVLLCSESTEIDDAERFMRRTMCKCKANGRPIFCLAFADKLKFNVSQAIENIYNELKKKPKYMDEVYQLVILTSKSDHYINGFFEKYQITKWPSAYNVTEISRYLKKQLIASHGYNDDNGNSLVKIVTSSRSGVGKSLFVNKLKNELDPRWYEENDHMKEFLRVLNRIEDEDNAPRRNLPTPLVSGQPNHIICKKEKEILPSLLAIYMYTPTTPLPLPFEVLLCSWQTTEDEVERFMRLAICTQENNSQPIFAMAYCDRLNPEVAERILQIHGALSANAHARDDYQFVMLSTRIGNFRTFKQFCVTNEAIDQAGITAYFTQRRTPEEKTLPIEEYSTTDEEFGIGTESWRPLTSKWHKTTIRLLEKDIDNNHVLKRLYGDGGLRLNEGSQEDQENPKRILTRNEDNHFVHLDLTPAVERGIERFMFNLLVLGSIQDDEGRVWNRQSQHLYVIEVTKSALNTDQISKHSILNLLPCMRCLSPSESLKRYCEMKLKIMEILQEVVKHTDEESESAISEYLERDFLFETCEFNHHEQVLRVEKTRLFEVLQMSDIPNYVICDIMNILPEDAKEVIEDIYNQQDFAHLQLMDYNEFLSTKFQRPYQYLKRANTQNVNLDEFQYSRPEGSPRDCIEVLQTAYGSPNPNWAQLRHFTSFLNVQLQNCEESVFCQRVGQEKGSAMSWEHTELEGLKEFAVNFMIRMAQDFATPSLEISDQSSKDFEENEQNILESHRIRRRWEEKCHPYIFFNEDRASMSFINVNLNKRGDLLDESGKVMAQGIASKRLLQGLVAQGIRFGFNFENLSRQDKLDTLRTIMGLPTPTNDPNENDPDPSHPTKNDSDPSHPTKNDPDPSYELTTENVLKIIAIYMRMRCNIPVILMGETGCGKTRLVEFMSKLRACGEDGCKNMVTSKIHGGVTARHIYESVRKASEIACENRKKGMSTVLFYDEANTTTAIYAIKEVVCDSTIDGESFHDRRLQIVAACNPYKCLTDNAIKKLENLGLGYRVAASETSSCLGRIPMRRLVYKVVALPPSMQPFVWDFGQLSLSAEQKYIRQMTVHLKKSLKLSKNDKDLIDFLLFQAQSYMKEMKDECRYVSLRDVERCMKFFTFFHNQSEYLFPKIAKILEQEYGKSKPPMIPKTLRCLLQTIGVCYHVSLDERTEFRKKISECLKMVEVDISESDINEEFIACQKIFLSNLRIPSNIAGNEALRENVFLITICMELRIPLFLVGKPGSSKSLAKTIVADNMEGKRSRTALYRHLKQVHMVSYQCSALTDADGIENIFKKASELQKDRDLKTFTSVVVLDEIGLAEDSPNMPLKILHPLLECGSTISGTIVDINPNEKVGFVGISNWALDPAKMNRGIFLTRSTPGEEDLLVTAKAIMHKEIRVMKYEGSLLESLTKTYLKIYNDQRLQGTKEYFGLRDYYSLIKMVNAKSISKERAEFQDVAHAVQRNFSGGKKTHHEDFIAAVKMNYCVGENCKTASVQEMITENLSENDTRFLLLLTSQHSTIVLLEHIIPDFHQRVQVIYGSGFSGDNTYTEICKNINRIKVCMETGRTVMLLNMTEVHESLYDALNQHYSIYGGQRYVDIGLGGHRLKCRVADNFRLIVLEQKEIVYQRYPIPLINRLEKHHLVSSSLLSAVQNQESQTLSLWANTFAKIGNFKEKDAFIGFHGDTVSSIMILLKQPNALEAGKQVLLQSTTADAVFRSYKNLNIVDRQNLLKIYTTEQVHDSLLSLLEHQLQGHEEPLSVLEVASFSNILTETDRKKLASALKLPENSITLLALQQFDTQQDYIIRLEKFFGIGEEYTEHDKILLIQCPQAQQHATLLACAKYCLKNLLRRVGAAPESRIIVAFLHSTRRQHADKQLVLQHTCSSRIVYVDDLRPPSASNPLLGQFYWKTIADVLRMGAEEIGQGAGPHEGRINLLGMLKDTVCQAMTAVKRNNKTDARNLECINLLTRMCQQNEWIARGFSSGLARRMADIYKERDSTDLEISWIIAEASSAENLQEGGTLGKTLCLCLKSHLAKLLAFIISAVDENNNLSFLFNGNQNQDSGWQVRTWLQFFEVFELEWSQMRDMKEFLVKFVPHLSEDFSPQLPFSFALNNSLESQWLAVRDEDQAKEMLFNQFKESAFAKIIENASSVNGPEIAKAYAADIIRFSSNLGTMSSKDHEALTKILIAMTQKVIRNSPEYDEIEQKVTITDIFFTFQEYFQHLSMLSKIFKVFPDVLSKANDWVEEQNNTDTFVIHALAMTDLLDWVAAYKIDDEESCIDWMKLTEKCKKIYHPNTSLIETSAYKQEIVKRWEPISLLNLFLSCVLPSSGAQDQSFTEYVKVVINHARRLLNPLKKFGFRDKNFLRIVLNVLRKSYEDITLKILMSWQDLSCKMCRKAFVDPVALPCGHFMCKDCVDRMFASSNVRRQCPICPSPIPQDFSKEPAVLSTNGEKEAAKLKTNCTSFFLEYLAQFCFSETESEMQDQLHLFLHELVVGIPIPANEDRMELETLAIDLNITTRSNILQLLLHHDAVMVETKVDELLLNGDLAPEEKENLIVVALSLFEMTSHGDSHGDISWDEMKLNWKAITDSPEIRLAWLKQLAALRCSLQRCVLATRKELLDPVVFSSVNLCNIDKTETLKNYMVKIGCQFFGTDWFDFVTKHKLLADLVPNQLKESDNTRTIDHWVLFGDGYVKMRHTLNTTPYSEFKDQIPNLFQADEPIDELLPRILAVVNFENPQYFLSLQDHMSNDHDSEKDGIVGLFSVINMFKDEEIFALSGNQRKSLIQLLILSNSVVQCQPYMMREFLHLCQKPQEAAEWFWPAMPVSLFFSIREILAHETEVAAYKCPNGHMYLIGECTEPWYEETCNECGEIIGGMDHVPARGNERVEHAEGSEAGFQLKSDTTGKDDPSDRMSKQGVAIVHFILHSCLLIALKQDTEFVCGMLQENTETAEKYLYQKLQDNIHDLSDAMGRNYDDALTVMNTCLIKILATGFKINGDDCEWTTMQDRQKWEDQFRKVYLLPVFRNLDEVLMESQRTINDIENLHDLTLYRLMHEITTEEQPADLTWNHPMLWRTVKHPEAPHLLQTIRDSASTGGALKVILESPDLHLLQHLDKVLRLQKILIGKYQNQKDLEEVEKITFAQYKDDQDGFRNRKLVDEYIKLWNSIYDIFSKRSKLQLKEYLHPIGENSPVTMALPSSRGRGRCAKLLAEYLINIHNHFLENCSKVIRPVPSTHEVEVSQLRGPDYILIDKQIHLLKMIRMHTSYTITKDTHGTHHNITYDIDALEKKVREKYVIYKPRIRTKSLPCINYPQDIGIGSDWTRVLDHIPQEPLSNKLTQEVDAIVTNQGITPADVCEGVRTVTHAISFLAKIKVDEKKTLQRYLEDTLLLSPNHMVMIPKSALVSHTLALYQRLMWRKAANFVQQGLDPYKEALYKVEQCNITDVAVLRQLKEAFERMDMAMFQQRLNEMLIQVPDFNPNWSLKELIFPNLEFIDDDTSDDWFEKIPEEICFKHVSHLFQLSVKGIDLPNAEGSEVR